MRHLFCDLIQFLGPKRMRGMAHPSLALRAKISLLLLVLMSSSVQAELDPGVKKPYHLEIVLQVGANRVFTPLFQEQLQRDVQNQLKLHFGNLARVEVTRVHPLLGDIEAKGLDAAIESWESLSERTTHFVLLDYRAGTYQIQTRFHDGLTGQAAPLRQHGQTHDRAGVAGAIASLIETSFCPVGAVTAVAPGGKDVTLKLQGGELGVPMDRWVQRGQVFAVSRIHDENGKQRAARLEWALLEVIDAAANGVCTCKYRHRYQEDTLSESPGTLGYRVLRLPTVKEAVKVQLLDDTTLQPLDGVRVVVSRPDVVAGTEKLRTNRDGLAGTQAAFAHLAWVQVLSGDTVRAQFPVEVIPGRTVIARVKIQTDREALAPLEARRDAWLRRVYDNVRMSSERSRELSGQLNQSLKAAVDSGRKSLPLLEAEITYLDREHDQLHRLVKDKNLGYDLREGRQQIDDLRKQAADLKAFVERIEAVLKEPGNEESLGLHKLLERAKLLEREADFDKAIRLYEQVVQANPDQSAKIKTYLDRLKADWKEKNDDHALARKFIYETWPTLDVAGLGKRLEEAKKHLAACERAGDKLTPRKLLLVNVVHTVNLKKQLDTLKRRDTEDNRNQAKIVVQISEGLLRLHDDAAAFVGKRD